MEGRSAESQVLKSEPESETPGRSVDDNVVGPCESGGVKREPVDGASLSDLADPGGDFAASPVEGMFKFHTATSEENPGSTSRLSELAGGEQVTAHRVKDESDIYDPCEESLDSPPEPAQPSSPDHKSLVDVIIPADYVAVKLEEECSAQSGSQGTSSERGPTGSKRSRGHSPSKKSPSRKGRDRPGRRGDGDPRSERKRPRSAAVTEANRKYGEMADAKVELAELQIAIAKSKLKRLKNSTSILEAETKLRRAEHEIKLQTLENRYERELEKEKLRAAISKIDLEIQKCILMKKRPPRQREGSPKAC